eukprot:scaffold3046_cov105-Cylindrotheca_fusiformis.AAC.2
MEQAKTVSITYVDPDGDEKTVDAEIGQNLLNVAHENNVELEGACGGELACSTCHLIFEEEIFKTLPEMEEDEEDMLDLAFEVTDTSRLGCQILVREDFEGMKVRRYSIPARRCYELDVSCSPFDDAKGPNT